jgi:pyruvate formate lyase activating enzyme
VDHQTLGVREAQALPIAHVLRAFVREGRLYRRLDDAKVRCVACGHRCVIYDGLSGICRVRFNEGGKLYVPWGYVGALEVDPIEKKPFYHAYPGARTLSFGMLGCDFQCPFCQNWQLSQVLRDAVATRLAGFTPITPGEFAALAVRCGARVVASTYNEPLITSEWAGVLFQESRKHGLAGAYVSNGNATPDVLDYIRPWVDLYKIDLKTMRERSYRTLGGRLQTVLDAIRMAWERHFWVEVVTLVVPGFNDSDAELRDAARYVASVSPDIPWHVTAFAPGYRMTNQGVTPPGTLVRAAELGRAEGLKFVYAGNLPGQVGPFEHTYCPKCGALLIARDGFGLGSYRILDGQCPDCGESIPGVWWPAGAAPPQLTGAMSESASRRPATAPVGRSP